MEKSNGGCVDEAKDVVQRRQKHRSAPQNSFSSCDILDRQRYIDDDDPNGDLAMNQHSSDIVFRKSHSVVQLPTCPVSPTQSNQALLSPVLAATRKTMSTIQIPIAASAITLTLPTPTAVIIALKKENFASFYLHRIFHHCKVNFSFSPLIRCLYIRCLFYFSYRK